MALVEDSIFAEGDAIPQIALSHVAQVTTRIPIIMVAAAAGDTAVGLMMVIVHYQRYLRLTRE